MLSKTNSNGLTFPDEQKVQYPRPLPSAKSDAFVASKFSRATSHASSPPPLLDLRSAQRYTHSPLRGTRDDSPSHNTEAAQDYQLPILPTPSISTTPKPLAQLAGVGTTSPSTSKCTRYGLFQRSKISVLVRVNAKNSKNFGMASATTQTDAPCRPQFTPLGFVPVIGGAEESTSSCHAPIHERDAL